MSQSREAGTAPDSRTPRSLAHWPVLEMLGIRGAPLDGEAASSAVAGWDEAEREVLHARILARQRFRISGELMFNNVRRFIGCRGIGVEVITRR